MAKIVDLDALKKAAQRSKSYTDESIIAARNTIDIDMQTKQDKIDNTLETDDKTVAGAINELKINKADKTELFSGSYNDLTDKPDIPTDKVFYTYRKKEFDKIVNTSTTYPKSDYEFEGRMDFVVGKLYRIEMHNSKGDIFTYDCVSEEMTNGYGDVFNGLSVIGNVMTDGQWNVSEAVDVNNANQNYSNLVLSIMGLDTVSIAQYPMKKIVISEIEKVTTEFFETNRTITEDERIYWNNKQDKEDESLSTEDKTIVGAINELKDELTINDETVLEFNPDLLDSYLEYYETAYGLIYCKIANVDAIPENISEYVGSGHTLKLYDSAEGGAMDLPANIEYRTNDNVYFVNDDTFKYYQTFIIAPTGWYPSGVSHSPGIWIKYQTGSYHDNIEYPISIAINNPKSVKDELVNVIDTINKLKSEHIYKAPDTIYEYTFDPDKRTEYEEVTGSTVSGDFKIAELEDLPPIEILDQCECILTCYNIEFGTASGTATLLSLDSNQTGYSIYFENDNPVQSGSAYILYRQWTPGPGYTYSPGVWIRCSDRDGKFSYQQNIKFILPNEDTKERTLVEAIHEDKEDIKDIKNEIITDKSIHYSFDVENIEQYDRFSPGSYGYTYCKLTDEIPDIDLENATGTITIYTHDKGIITGPISVTKSGNPTRYFIGVEGDDRNPLYILPTGWYPNAGVNFSEGVWTQRYLYEGKEHYLISATIDNIITIKNEISTLYEEKADITYVDESVKYMSDDVYEYKFDLDKMDEYECIPVDAASNYYKIAELEDLPPNVKNIRCVLTYYHTDHGLVTKHSNRYKYGDGIFLVYFNNPPVNTHNAYLLYEDYPVDSQHTYTPGLWVKYRDKNDVIEYHETLRFAIPCESEYELSLSAAINDVKYDSQIDEHELISMLEEELGLKAEE